MPQLNFASPLTISQVVWMAIIFFTLYLLLANWALPKVAAVLDHRASTIAADLDAAKHAKAEADAAVAEVQAATRRSRAEAQAQINEAVARAKAEAEARSREADTRLEAQLREAETRIASARTAAMGALREVATDTAASVLQRLTGHTPDHASIDTAVGDVIARRQAA